MKQRPLAETTTDTWDAALEHIARHTSADAYELTALTALLQAEFHHLVLDPTTRTVWWAYDADPADVMKATELRVQQLAPDAAADDLGDIVSVIQDRQDDLDSYAKGWEDLDRDQAALDEYAAVLLLALPVEPGLAAAQIKRQRRSLARQDALQQRAYARLVTELAGPERGGKTRAGKALGVTDVQIGRIIREDQERRTLLASKVSDAREGYDR
ncbi:MULTISPECIES: hypothetical protein [Streptomycetaceae]|uniref:hypothetical protein n=1 Tax=Streptomycetaceae TaxID=2062 RepID=UPI000939F4A8|nr:hypothetical protein [Streptomyces sp. CB02056]OKH97557.1 hypothetical protein AMK13_38310 [Streptomyces sp. CB02056]